MSQSPLILLAISSREFSDYVLWPDMYRGLHQAGLVSVSIDTSVESIPIQQLMAEADGLVLGGGGDVSPLLYGGDPGNSTLQGVNPLRDANEVELVHHALQKGVPVLGICRGAQVINVVRGGTLVQDVRRDIGTSLNHHGPEETLHTALHTVEVAADSLLSRLLCISGAVEVNSAHHQAIAIIGGGLRVSAQAADGVIEAIESTESDEILLGVQWHPENLWPTQHHANTLLRNFSDLCGTSLRAQGTGKVGS